MVERKRRRYFYWKNVLFYAVFLMNFRILFMMAHDIFSEAEEDQNLDGNEKIGSECPDIPVARFFSPSETTREGYPRLLLCILDADAHLR